MVFLSNEWMNSRPTSACEAVQRAKLRKLGVMFDHWCSGR
jgi:hypothetical protein